MLHRRASGSQVKELVAEGGVTMKMLEKGDGWKKPKETDVVHVRYTVTLEEDWTLMVCFAVPLVPLAISAIPALCCAGCQPLNRPNCSSAAG